MKNQGVTLNFILYFSYRKKKIENVGSAITP